MRISTEHNSLLRYLKQMTGWFAYGCHKRPTSTPYSALLRIVMTAVFVLFLACPPAMAGLTLDEATHSASSAPVTGNIVTSPNAALYPGAFSKADTDSSAASPLPPTFYYYLLAILIGAASTLNFVHRTARHESFEKIEETMPYSP